MSAPSQRTRGSIWWCDFSPVVGHEQRGRRPALLVSQDRLNQGRSGLVIVAVMTSQPPKVPSHLPAPASLTGCAKDGTILCEHLRTVSVERLSGPRLGQAAPALMAQVDACLKRLLALT